MDPRSVNRAIQLKIARAAIGTLTLLLGLAPREVFCNDSTDIVEAIRTGNEAATESLIDRDPNLAFAYNPIVGRTSLHLAAHCGRANIVALLLAHNADVNEVDRHGSTPLHEAARFRDKDDTDVNTFCKSPDPISHREVADLLLQHDAFVDYPDQWGNTPLLVAVSNNVAQLLLEHGANPNHVNLNGDNALLLAARNRDAERVELLLRYKADITPKDKDGNAPLMLAVQLNAEPVIRLLLANHADANTRNSLGSTPLHYARNKDAADLLLAYGAEVDAVNQQGSTPLCRAAFGGHMELAAALLANKADVNFKCRHRSTPVHEAVFTRHPEVAEFLRRHGGHE